VIDLRENESGSGVSMLPVDRSLIMALEIERKYLLRSRPDIPAGAEVWRIEQGYLPPAPPEVGAASTDNEILFGRLRRTTMADGSSDCTHTVKQGIGMVREESQRFISLEEFERHWPRTEGRRLRKSRYRVREGGFIWEVDVFEEPDLVLAEVELPAVDTVVVIPDWLKPHVVREVTGEPKYANSSIAARVGASG
jgi:CYTH domain-containing protein